MWGGKQAGALGDDRGGTQLPVGLEELAQRRLARAEAQVLHEQGELVRVQFYVVSHYTRLGVLM